MADVGRIKRNVAKMVEQGAPETDIDQYISGEGVTLDQIRSAPKEVQNSPTDYLRLVNSYIPGSARLIAGIKSATTGEDYSKALTTEQGLQDTAFDRVDPVMGTLARTAGLTGIAAGTMGIGMLNSSLPATAPALARIGEGARIGAGVAAPTAYLDSRSQDPVGRTADVALGALGGAALGAAIPAAIDGAGAARRFVGERLRSGVAPVATDFQEAGVPFMPGAASTNPLTRWITGSIARSPVGGPLADQAGRSVRAADARINELMSIDGAIPTPAQSGQDVQNLLRRNLTEPSTPPAVYRTATPEQLQDITGIAPGPAYNPKPPRVDPVRTPVPPISPDVYLQGIGDGIPPVKPRQANSVPQYRPVSIDDIATPPDMQTREGLLRAESKRLADLQATVAQERAALQAEIEPFRKDYTRGGQQFTQYEAPQSTSVSVARARQLDDQLALIERQRQDVDTEINGLYKTWAEQRPKLHAEAQQKANAEAEAEAARRYAIQQREYLAEAQRETERLRQEAIEAARPNANAQARAEWEARRATIEASDRRATEKLQQEADARFQAELAARKIDDTSFQLGRSQESYPSEFAAAYEQVNRNAPKVQSNILGEKFEPTPTSVAKLIADFGLELRRGGKLPGFKGSPFDADGRLRQDLVLELNKSLGPGITKTILHASEARARGLFTPGIRGIHDMRTEVGRALREVRASRYSPSPRSEDEALLARLYRALDDQIAAASSLGGDAGQAYLRQRGQIDSAYKQYIEELRRPLNTIYGDKVSPEQGMKRLADSARKDGGNVNLLRSFFRVANDKGDPLRATKAILSESGAKDGLEGMVTGYRQFSPEAKAIMFDTPAGRELEVSIQRLARIHDKMGPFLEAARRSGQPPNFRDLMRGSNMAMGVGLYYMTPYTIAGAAGSHVLARFLASPRYAAWLQKVPQAGARGIDSQEWINHVSRLAVLSRDNTEDGRQIMEAVAGMVTPAKAGTSEAFSKGNFDRQPGRAGPMYPADLEESTPEIKDRVTAIRGAIDSEKAVVVEYGKSRARFRPMDFIESKTGDISVVGIVDGKWRTFRLDRMNFLGNVPLRDSDAIPQGKTPGDGHELPVMMKLGGPKPLPDLPSRYETNDDGIVRNNDFVDDAYNAAFEVAPFSGRQPGTNQGPRGMPPRRTEDPAKPFYNRTGRSSGGNNYNDIFDAWESIRSKADEKWPGMFPGFGKTVDEDNALDAVRDKAEIARTNRGPDTMAVFENALMGGVPRKQIEMVARDIGLLPEWKRHLVTMAGRIRENRKEKERTQ